MTRRDYVRLALAFKKALQSQPTHSEQVGIWMGIHTVANALAEDNPRFNRDLFYRMCGIDPVEDPA